MEAEVFMSVKQGTPLGPYPSGKGGGAHMEGIYGSKSNVAIRHSQRSTFRLPKSEILDWRKTITSDSPEMHYWVTKQLGQNLR